MEKNNNNKNNLQPNKTFIFKNMYMILTNISCDPYRHIIKKLFVLHAKVKIFNITEGFKM